MIIHLYCGVFVQRTIQERGMHLITPYTGVSLGRVQPQKVIRLRFSVRYSPESRLYSRIIFHGSPGNFKAPESSQDLHHSS